MADADYEGLAEIFTEVLGIPLPDPDDELVGSGLLDSMSIVTLVVEIEEKFGVEIAPEDLNLLSFSTVRGMAEMVRASRTTGSSQPVPRATDPR
jgi:D-alanine--poly(phosphoribitol) ligase subunit 2